MTTEVVFIADDFGVSDRVNEAIVHAHREGVLTGACLMLGQPATVEAVSLAREHPSLQVGWHMHLTDSRPMTRPEWPWGRSPAKAGFAIGLSAGMRELARREIECQWEAFQATGLPCHFVNAHHHLHVHPWVRRVLMETLPKGFEGWVRYENGLGSAFHAGCPTFQVGFSHDVFLETPMGNTTVRKGFLTAR